MELGRALGKSGSFRSDRVGWRAQESSWDWGLPGGQPSRVPIYNTNFLCPFGLVFSSDCELGPTILNYCELFIYIALARL